MRDYAITLLSHFLPLLPFTPLKALLRDYAIKHDIPDEAHMEMLHALSWTAQEFDRGIKQTLLPDGKRKSSQNAPRTGAAVHGPPYVGNEEAKASKPAPQQEDALAASAADSPPREVGETGPGERQGVRGEPTESATGASATFELPKPKAEAEPPRKPATLVQQFTGKMAAAFKGQPQGEGARRGEERDGKEGT